jgi:hypothetical protein
LELKNEPCCFDLFPRRQHSEEGKLITKVRHGHDTLYVNRSSTLIIRCHVTVPFEYAQTDSLAVAG